MKNRKGFTLIELLAVIVILGVLMAIAIPSMQRVIRNSKRNTYISTAKMFVSQARYDMMSGLYKQPGVGKYIVIATDRIELEQGSKKSTYGFDYDKTKSYVVILNDGVNGNAATEASDNYVYFVAMVDTQGYGFTLAEENKIEGSDVKSVGIASTIKAISSIGTLSKTDLNKVSTKTLSTASFTLETGGVYQ